MGRMTSPESEALRAELERQAALQREADHRVKNNLQLISSLVLLQGRRAREEPVRQALKAVLQRISAVSVAHRHVVRPDDSERVEVSGLARELVGDLAATAGREGIEIGLDLEPVHIPARDGAPLALLISETVGNALRHAFPEGRRGRVEVAVRRTPEGYELTVADDGVGMPQGAPAAGFGMTIVQLLAQQLRGRLETGPAQPGFRLAVRVPMEPDPQP